jgi:hypothetical protein
LPSGQVLLPLEYDKKEKKELNILKVPIVFTPRECILYNEKVIIDINNLHKIEV